MEIYDGGSADGEKDSKLFPEIGNSVPSYVTSKKNQMFINFTHSNGVGKGFTAKITFGKY